MQLSIEKLTPEHLTDNWDLLVNQMSRPSPFLSKAWMAAWLDNKKTDKDALLIRGSRGGRIVGLLPLLRQFRRVEDSFLPCRVLSIPGSLDMDWDHLDVIAGPDDRADFLEAVVHFLAKDFSDWDILFLSRVPEDSSFVVFQSLMESEFPLFSREASRAFVLDSTIGMDEIMKALSSGKRRQVRRDTERFFTGPQNVFAVSTGDELLDDLDCLLDLHRNRISELSKRSIFDEGNSRAMLRQVVSEWGTEHTVLGKLKSHGKIVALNLAFRFGGRYFGYQMAMADSARKAKSGHVLLARMIEHSCQDECFEFDFLRGGGRHKGFWTKQYRTLYNIAVVNHNAFQPINWSGLYAKRVIRHFVNTLKDLKVGQ